MKKNRVREVELARPPGGSRLFLSLLVIVFASPAALGCVALAMGSAGGQLADETWTGVVPPAQTGAKLVASGGGDARTRARDLTLSVERTRSRRFSLRVSPKRRTVTQGASATYRVRVARAAGFRTRVTLRARGLPRGARARWKSGTLTVSTRPDQRLGTNRLVIEGTSRVGGKAVRRRTVAVLTVVEARRFRIGGDLGTPMYPGSRAPLDLVLTNPNTFDIRVTSLSVSVGGTTNAHCSGRVNYGVAQYRGRYPLVLHPGSTRLSALVSDTSGWPQISMHDLPTNQDACQGAVLSLGYSGRASR
jgi:hypothetical protein